MSQPATQNELIEKKYEAGKTRRYNLMFAVLALWLEATPAPDAGADWNTPIMGDLMVWHIGLGMAAFSLVMGVDIWAFGTKCARAHGDATALFQPVGKSVLLTITALLILGWLLGSGILTW